MTASVPKAPWQDIDTVLVDMDGTLLDLAFDNFFWQELVPAQYAAKHGLSEANAQDELARRYRREEGHLNWYCVDYWTRELGLDIEALKWQHRHLIGFLPGAPEFLAAVRAAGKRITLVTNAHQVTLAVKVAQTGIDAHVDDLVSSHELARCKEQSDFWPALRRHKGFVPERTLLIEDSLPVLAAARAFGLAFTIAVRRPDSRRPPRDVADFPSVEGVSELV